MSNSKKTAIGNIDILIYVALAEEFQYVLNSFEMSFTAYEMSDIAQTLFIGDKFCPSINRNFRVAMILAGKMGNTVSSNLTATLIHSLNPKNVIVLGIAGSLDVDLTPGDVFVPHRIVEYFANSAATGDKKVKFITSANYFDSSKRLINRFQLFGTTQKAEYQSWLKKVEQNVQTSIDARLYKALKEIGIEIGKMNKLLAGDDKSLASGPTVGKSKAFAEFLKKEVDRKIVAIEMESAGVFEATLGRIAPIRVIAIRGISDFADDRKDKLEERARKIFRELAIKNAVSLTETAIEAGIFAPEKSKNKKERQQQSLIKRAFLIGGVTTETRTPTFEVTSLQKGAEKIGRMLARAKIELIVCSPFPDSADYHALFGYAKERKGGIVHFHFPMSDSVFNTKKELELYLGQSCPTIVDWQYPAPDNDDSWEQAWLLCQLHALEQADAIIAIGGKVSKSANTLLHLAEKRGIVIVPFTFLGGAAQRSFDRIDWALLHPTIKIDVLKNEKGIDSIADLLNNLKLDTIRITDKDMSKANRFFISRAKEDNIIGFQVGDFLKNLGFTVLYGESAINDSKMILPSIEEYLRTSDMCLVLWSKYYALSTWCYDELMLAINRQNVGHLKIIVFNLDESAIVPKEARTLPIFYTKSAIEIQNVLSKKLGK
jgi:nucleoside phosphorylase